MHTDSRELRGGLHSATGLERTRGRYVPAENQTNTGQSRAYIRAAALTGPPSPRLSRSLPTRKPVARPLSFAMKSFSASLVTVALLAVGAAAQNFQINTP